MNTEKRLILILVFLMLPASAVLVPAETKPAAPESREYKIKAAFLYNFLKTCEWPAEVADTKTEPYRIGLVGEDLFGDSFKPVEGQQVRGKKIEIHHLKGFGRYSLNEQGVPDVPREDLKAIQSCQILFICKSEKAFVADILTVTRNSPILTVSEVDEFLESGGMINFLPEATKGDFEVSLVALEEGRLKISSKLLRIAKRVVKE